MLIFYYSVIVTSSVLSIVFVIVTSIIMCWALHEATVKCILL